MPLPNLGATLTQDGIVISTYSSRAHAIDVAFFDPKQPEQEAFRQRMTPTSGHLWVTQVEGIEVGWQYGFRVSGSHQPEHGDFFQPEKLLLDPYAREISRDSCWNPSMQGRDSQGRRLWQDNAPEAFRSVIIDESFDWLGVRKPEIPWRDTVIYETHVKGLTKTHPDLPPEIRGTYAGVASEPVIEHLKKLGITTIQLLPVHWHLHDPFLIEKGLRNYWGYSSIGFFAPHSEYAAENATPGGIVREFKTMVRKLHAAGIEVILDVVYNHTGEGGVDGPLINFRGLDNSTYYRIDPRQPERYVDYTGTGNSFNLHHPITLQLVMDSLRYWATEMQVDGFRFDLAVTLGREQTDFSPLSAFFKAIAQDPVLSKVKLIAEPWDIGWGGYQLGNFPAGWSELNGQFRDLQRRFWKGDRGLTSEFATRFAGSIDHFGQGRRGPLSSINLITSHDGFTLHDLVSYQEKHNLENGENNRDGDQHNLSWNSGIEGETKDPEILQLREKRKRNFLAITALSAGVPFFLGGDEFGRTQRGNNNAYCQDNEISWFDWSLLKTEEGASLFEFLSRILEFRRNHPCLRPEWFYYGADPHLPDRGDLSWWHSSGHPMRSQDWDHSEPELLAAHFAGSTTPTLGWPGTYESQASNSVLIIFNPTSYSKRFTLPPHPGPGWQLRFNTAIDGGERKQMNHSGMQEKFATHPGASMLLIPPMSILVLEGIMRNDSDESPQ